MEERIQCMKRLVVAFIDSLSVDYVHWPSLWKALEVEHGGLPNVMPQANLGHISV